ncbi:MAG TPA: PAS domain-containing protein, partial [Cytophagales bacterium]
DRTGSFPERINKVLLQKHTPPALVINLVGDILYIHGRTGKYLEPAPGQNNTNVYEMAREGLPLELRGAVLRASTQAEPVVVPKVSVKTNGHYQSVKLTVEQLAQPEELKGLLLVTFQDLPTHPKRPAKKVAAPATEKDQIIGQLEQELTHTREHLQRTIEQMQTTLEELKSANEELQSTNEELQSTNEESNTAKEEMQALNEELMTVNMQARAKADELVEVNNDMVNLLNSSEIATLFLSNTLHVKRFTPSVTRIIPLVPTDIGRPVTHLACNLRYEHLERDVKEVLAKLSTKEVEVESTGGQWYQLRIVPYRTLDNFISGAVLSFQEITRVKGLQSQLQEARDLSRDLLDGFPAPALVLDRLFRVVAANGAFLHALRAEAGQLLGQFFYQLGNGAWEATALHAWLAETLAGSAHSGTYRVDGTAGRPGVPAGQLRARPLRTRGEAEGAPCLLVTLEEAAP